MIVIGENAHAIAVPATGSQQVLGGPSLLMGWSFLESTGAAAATVEVYDGYGAGAQLVTAISLSAGQSTRDWLGPHGIYCSEGLFVNVVAGSVRGALWARVRAQAGSG